MYDELTINFEEIGKRKWWNWKLVFLEINLNKQILKIYDCDVN